MILLFPKCIMSIITYKKKYSLRLFVIGSSAINSYFKNIKRFELQISLIRIRLTWSEGEKHGKFEKNLSRTWESSKVKHKQNKIQKLRFVYLSWSHLPKRSKSRWNNSFLFKYLCFNGCFFNKIRKKSQWNNFTFFIFIYNLQESRRFKPCKCVLCKDIKKSPADSLHEANKLIQMNKLNGI